MSSSHRRRRRVRLPLLAAGLTGLTLAVASCGGASDTAGADGETPIAVSSSPQVTTILEDLAGDGVDVRELVSPTADLHDVELQPSQVRALRDASLLVRPGRDNDHWVEDALPRTDAEVVDASQGLPGSERHWWMDPTAAAAAARTVASALDRLDPGGADARSERLTSYLASLDRVDGETRRCLKSVPSGGRRIITDHDAIGAYAERYDLDVVATIAPGEDPESAPSAGRIAELTTLVRSGDVAAIFPIAPHGSPVAERLAQQGRARLGQPLWADALPSADAGLPETAALNGRSVAAALGASGAACAELDA